MTSKLYALKTNLSLLKLQVFLREGVFLLPQKNYSFSINYIDVLVLTVLNILTQWESVLIGSQQNPRQFQLFCSVNTNTEIDGLKAICVKVQTANIVHSKIN